MHTPALTKRFVAALGGLASLVCTASVAAQAASDSAPAGFAPKRTRAVVAAAQLRLDSAAHPDAWSDSRTVRLGVIDASALLAEDAARAAQSGVPLRLGINRPVPGGLISPTTGGSWTTLPDGGAVWTLRVQAADAKAVRVHFAQFDLEDGAGVVVRGAAGDADAYRGKGPNRDGAFWAAATSGDSVYIEYFDPTGKRDVRLAIDEISYLYREPGFDPPIPQPNAPGGGPTEFLLSCEQDVMCFTVDQAARDSVACILFTVSSGPNQGTFLCSGALLNDVDSNTYAGYFLTANHCISSQATASTLTAYWFYQSLTCGGSVPGLATLPKSNGATLLATSSQSDFTFMRLNTDPEDGQGFAAWTTTVPSANGAIVRGIHHPGGSFKRFSEGSTTTAAPICLPSSRFVSNDWTVGVTEGGSSGSPLFNANWEVVGQLFGVCYTSEPGCDNPQDYNNVYGRFSYSYPSFSSYLNTITPDDAFENNDTTAEAPILDVDTYALRLVDFDDYFKIAIGSDADVTVWASFNPADMDLDLYLLDAGGAVIATSAGLSGVESIVMSVPAGTYFIHALKDTGWGGDYTLDYSALLSVCTPPAAALAETGGFTKSRFISMEPGATSQPTAVRVTLASLHHPDPPNNPGAPRPDFSV
ncbi:MAG: serine protease, partial [Phycisphaerales bacterium]|nr:serine protease [Phycisphaerales bacterium]